MNGFFITLLIGIALGAATFFAFFTEKHWFKNTCAIIFVLCCITVLVSLIGLLEASSAKDDVADKQAYYQMVEADLVEAFDGVGRLTYDAYQYNVWLYRAKRDLEKRGRFSAYYNTGLEQMKPLGGVPQ